MCTSTHVPLLLLLLLVAFTHSPMSLNSKPTLAVSCVGSANMAALNKENCIFVQSISFSTKLHECKE